MRLSWKPTRYVPLLALLWVAALYLNNHLYYDLRLGYDFRQHLMNIIYLLQHGQMPLPPMTGDTYEAFQAPLFYVLVAQVVQFAHRFTFQDQLMVVLPTLLHLCGTVLAFAIAVCVRRILRRVPVMLTLLTISVVLLFPMQTEMAIMLGNDVPTVLFTLLGIFTLYGLCRSGRTHDATLWWRAAVWGGLAIIFKQNGIVFAGVYAGLALYIGIVDARQKRWLAARRMFAYLLLGGVLMGIPFLINNLHSSRYVSDPLQTITRKSTTPTLADVKPQFFLNFDLSFFNFPFAFEAGSASFWSLQYLTLHSDYYNHWNSNAYTNYPPSLMMTMPHRDPLPLTRVNTASTLQYLALPVTLLMLVAVGRALYQVLWRRQFALRDGSVVVVLYVGMAQAAQIMRFLAFPDIRAVLIHARYQGFLYGFLLMVRVEWFWKWAKQQPITRKKWVLLLAAVLSAYTLVAFSLMWLPPVDFHY